MTARYANHPIRMSVPECAELLGFDQETVRQALERGELPGHRVGKQWFISRRAIDRLLDGEWAPKVEPKIVKVVHVASEEKAA